MIARLKNIAGQSAIYGLGSLLPKAIGFLLIPLYTQYLSVADYGILSFVTTLMGVIAIFLELGLGNAVTRFHYEYLQNPDEQRLYYGTVWIFLTAAPLAIIAVLTWQGEALFKLLFQDIPFQPYGLLALWIAYLNLTSIIPLILFRVREQAGYYIAFTIGRFILNTLSIIYFVSYAKMGAEGSLRGQLLSVIIFSIPFTWVSLRNLKLGFDRAKLKNSLAFGVPLIPHQLAGWALSVFDRILLERYVSLTELGLYSLGYRFASILDLILSSFNMAWAPFLFRTAKEEEDAPQIFARMTTYYAIFVFFLAIGISACAREALMLMANPAYWDAYRVIPVVTLAYIASGVYYITVNTLFYTKQTQRLPIYTGLAALVNIGLNLLVLQKYGIMGAAWTTVIGYLISSGLVFAETRKAYPIPYEYRRLAALLAAATPFYLLGIWIQLENVYLALLVKLLLTAAFPAALFVFKFFTPRELTGMRITLQQFAHRLPFSGNKP